jgi:hypothetical protein
VERACPSSSSSSSSKAAVAVEGGTVVVAAVEEAGEAPAAAAAAAAAGAQGAVHAAALVLADGPRFPSGRGNGQRCARQAPPLPPPRLAASSAC